VSFEPKIVGFLCNWCSYAGADLAGVSRLRCAPNVRIIKVMCSGRVNELLMFKAFSAGADGVLVSGCHPGDCHYIKGNLNARRRVVGMKPFLEAMGIEPERVRLEWIGASEGTKFVEAVNSFAQTIKELGPSPLDGRHNCSGD
jgi:F420-non-reducing hydrogenase iron-sulfur subunit